MSASMSPTRWDLVSVTEGQERVWASVARGVEDETTEGRVFVRARV